RLIIPYRSSDTAHAVHSSYNKEQLHHRRCTSLAPVFVRSSSLERKNRGKKILEKRTRNCDHRSSSSGRPVHHRKRHWILLAEQTSEGQIRPVNSETYFLDWANGVVESPAARSCNPAERAVFRSFHHRSEERRVGKVW